MTNNETQETKPEESGSPKVTVDAAEWERILRLSAEFENSRKRLEKRSQEMVAYANEKLLLEFISVKDDLERAVAHLNKAEEPDEVQSGLKLTFENFKNVLARHGVEEIESTGQPFDAHRHEAIGEMETARYPEGTVAEEIMKGYLLNGRLLRPSRVRIAKKPVS